MTEHFSKPRGRRSQRPLLNSRRSGATPRWPFPLEAVLMGVVLLTPAALASVAPPASVLLSWDANTEADLAGYKVRHGTSTGTYTETLTVGNVTDVTLSGMTAGLTYYFVVSAYNNAGQEGPPSDEISFIPSAVAPPPPPPPPSVDVLLTWDANTEGDLAGYKVRHGVVSGTYTHAVDVGGATEATLSEMTTGVTYYFVVSAYNNAGQEGPPSDEISFTPGSTPPAFVMEPLTAPLAGDPALTAPIATISDWSPLASGAFSFTITANPGQVLAVFASPDMLNWELLGTTSNPTGRIQAIDHAAATAGVRYYQVQPHGG